MSKPTNLVLLIDDEPKIRRFIRAGFELHGGFTVQEAENAAEGLHAATFNTPDLIILDLALPDRRGTEVLDLVRSWSNVPIIVLSVEANEEEKVRLLEAGADDYVVKPYRRIDRAQPRGATAIFQERKGKPCGGRRSALDRSRQPDGAVEQQPDQADSKTVSVVTCARDPSGSRGHA
jgi:CheY-like chemotaxis protein